MIVMQVMIRLSSVKPFWFSGFIFIFDACNMSLKRDVFAARSSEMLCSFMFFHLSLKNKKMRRLKSEWRWFYVNSNWLWWSRCIHHYSSFLRSRAWFDSKYWAGTRIMFKIWYEKRSSSEKYGKFELVLAVYGSDVDVSLICISCW